MNLIECKRGFSDLITKLSQDKKCNVVDIPILP